MPAIVNAVTTRVQVGLSVTDTIASGAIYFKNDADAWEAVVPGSDDKLPLNCEFVPAVDGYRFWKPSTKPPYPPQWLPTDYWLDVVDANGVTVYATLRSRVSEQVELKDASSPLPAWRWTWNDNLEMREVGTSHQWFDKATGAWVFTKSRPSAWSKDSPDKVVYGTATVDKNGYVLVDIDLTGLSYPIILDPTTVFDASTNDTNPYRETKATWVSARGGNADGDDSATLHIIIAKLTVTPDFATQRGFLPFDTSSIPITATITSATLTMYAEGSAVSDADTTLLVVIQGSYTPPAPTTDYNALTFVSGGTMAYADWVITAGTGNVLTLDATGRGFITKAGTTLLAVINNLDLSDATPPAGINSLRFRSADNVAATPPQLTVAYTVPASGDGGAIVRRAQYRVLGLP